MMLPAPSLLTGGVQRNHYTHVQARGKRSRCSSEAVHLLAQNLPCSNWEYLMLACFASYSHLA